VRRFAYAAVSGRMTHHNASIPVLAEDTARSHLVWITDLLPDAMAETISALVEEGSVVMKKLWNQGQLRLVLV
jgi:hypothetical protein